MAVGPTITLPVDVDMRRLIAFTERLRDSLHEMAGHLHALGESFDTLTKSLAELEEDRARPDAAHRR